ncbi:MAG: retron Eco8 family effector endonuclease [bacterium]|nr:retron Eco8 family effector endonuclease [bacterium]
MGILKVQIENYKSIKKCSLSLNDINILIGENGSGKTNVISAIKYFYDNLLVTHNDESIFDANNKYSNCVKISITYNLHSLQIRCKQQISEGKSIHLPYFQKIVDIGNKGIIILTLIKIKDKKIVWKQGNESERALIHDLMPLYLIDSRSLDLTDWSNLWEHIGDLVKTENKISHLIKRDIGDIVDNEDYKLKILYDKLKKSFENANVKVEKFTPKKYARTLTQTYFEGSEFVFNNNKLYHFSNGTNSFNYTKLLIEVLILISEKKMKYPVIIIDEPEISLHHKLIDELSDRILDASKNIEFLISTHSPRMIKNIMMKDLGNSCVFHVRTIKQYSFISKMKLFNSKSESKPKIRITDQHANAYFARLLFSIEGETELELFENKFIKDIFPVLKQADIINKGMSDDVVKKIISPKIRRYSTPMIALVDMDKVICKNQNKNSFDIYEKFFNSYDVDNERYYYTEKRYKTYNTRKRIKAMSKKCKFNYNLPFFSSEDKNYKALLELIKSYFKEYGLIVAETTAEGMLINKYNQFEFWDFAKKHIFKSQNVNDIENYYDSFNQNNKLNFLRLLFYGKSDYILKLDQIKQFNPSMAIGLYDVIEKNRIDKTSGWVSKWIEYFLCSILNINYGKPNTYKEFKKAIEDNFVVERVRESFIENFQEIHEVISIMENAMKN